MPVPPLVQQLVQVIVKFPPLRIREEKDPTMRAVAEAARLCWLDWATAVLSGLHEPAVRALARVTGEPPELLKSLQASSRASQMSACCRLAFLLGMAAHVQDIDDTLPDCMVHAGAPVIAAAFSTGLVQDISGPQFLRAIAAGYEVISLVGRAINAPPRMATHARGFHPTGVVGVLGAAAAAATVIKLDGDGAKHSLSLATSMSSGLLEFLSSGGDTKALHAGKAAADGVMAASLAAVGLRGPGTALEGRDGLFRALVGESDQPGANWTVAVESAAVLRTQRKYFACCHHCHPPLEALAALRGRHPFSAEDVAKIEVRLPSMAAYQVAMPAEAKQKPSDPVEARVSLPYCLAAWLLLGDLGPSAFEPARVTDPKIVALAARIQGRPDPEMDALFASGVMPALVILRLRDGHDLMQAAALGSALEDPIAEYSRVKAKFTSLLASCRSAAALDHLWMTLDSVAVQGPAEGIPALIRGWNG